MPFKKTRHPCEGVVRSRNMYLATVSSATAIVETDDVLITFAPDV